jgi:hypothetical protein
MQEMWIQNITLTMGLVDTVSIPTLLKMVASGRIPAEKMGTHSFTFAQMGEAYDVFSDAAENSALKVVITPIGRRACGCGREGRGQRGVPVLYSAAASPRAGAGAGRPAACCRPGRRGSSRVSAAAASATAALIVMAVSMAGTELAWMVPAGPSRV